MKFVLEKASDFNFKEEIEVNTLEELRKAVNGQDVVIYFNDNTYNTDTGKWEVQPSITIYDDYIE